MSAVSLSIRDGIATITIDRPAVRNAMDREAAEAMAGVLDDFETSDDARVGILTGAGQMFCAGMDLKAFARSGELPLSRTRGAFGITERPPAKPLIAAVEGAALGGGLEIVLACDLVAASKTAQFGLPEVSRGLMAAGGGLVRLPRRIPPSRALELVLTGEPCSAAQAAEWGLVNWLCDPGQALETATRAATRIADNAPLAVQRSKRVLTESADWALDEWPLRQQPYTREVRESKDAAEGARAFAEHRTPSWRGC